MSYMDAIYSQIYILETVSDLEHLPEVREAHLKSSVSSFFQPVWGSKAAGGPYNESAMGKRLENGGLVLLCVNLD